MKITETTIAMSRGVIPIASAGYPYIALSAFITIVLALMDLNGLAAVGLVGTIFVGAFFRDPDRVVPDADGAVTSPADGKIIRIDHDAPCPFLEGRFIKISIFMNVFNVHVNRVPHDGVIRKTIYHPGKFLSANLDKASAENEHHAIIQETPDGRRICYVQIAGLVARRIVSYVRKGDAVYRGQRFGIICFGSRVDVYLPTHTQIQVHKGDKVKAGNSLLGFIPEGDIDA